MRLYPDWPHAGAAAAMWNGKCLVQIQMADIAANLAGFDQPDHGVQIGPVNINLPAVIMGDLADRAHGFLKHPMCGGVGDHAGGKPVARLCRFLAEIFQIDIAICRRFHNHHLHAAHLGRGRIGAMGRNRDQADIAVAFAPRAVIGLDCQQARIFPLRAGIGLHGHRIIARNLAEFHAQIGNGLGIALGLIGRAERVQRGELWPAERHHLCRRIQLHRARPQRDHRSIQRQIPIRKATHVAHHLGLSAVHMENRVGHIGRLPQERRGEAQFGPVRGQALYAKHPQDAGQNLLIRGFIQ